MDDAIAALNEALAGRYRILRELGQGGMATVYLADDLRHGRKVALKVLKPALSMLLGPERFDAEIRTTASLQHPHILPLFDSGTAAGYLFYVMPYVEGESIQARLAREHEFPVDEAIRIVQGVADALDHAHRHGVVHRDIKPANILLQDGEPLLADFGIALAIGSAAGSRLTETGFGIGTPHYMSPEQAAGERQIGPAADIFALSCVLYEMLAGEPPYTGNTPQAILAQIMTAEPVPVARRRRTVPPHVDAAIRKGLEPKPADRFRTAAAFSKALDHSGAGSGPMPGRHGAIRRRIGRIAGIGVLAMALATGAWYAGARWRPAAPPGVARFDVTPTEGRQPTGLGAAPDMAISPDGSRIVYSGVAPDGRSQLWVRALDKLQPEPIAGTEGGYQPDFSPDGTMIVFSTGDGIRTVPATGGPSIVVAQGESPRWGADGRIYFADNTTIRRVAATGGEAETVATPPPNTRLRFPDQLPDGRGFVVSVVYGYPSQTRIAVVGAEGGTAREILDGTMARYVPTGHLLYTTAAGTLMAVPFSVKRLEVTGPAVALVEHVAVAGSSRSMFAVSRSGALLYATGISAESELVWVDRAGSVERLDSTWTARFNAPALSPDGSRVTVAVDGKSSIDIWVKAISGGPASRLTFDGSRNDYPSWTPDGSSVTFPSDRSSPSFDFWTKRADGSADPVLELDEQEALAEPAWLPDGKTLVYRTSGNEAGAGDIRMFRRGGAAGSVPLVTTPFTELSPAVSPNGRWLAYVSNETGWNEIYVVPLPDADAAKWRISNGGGLEPVWSRDGKELFYRNGHGEMVSVRVSTDPTFEPGPATILFSAAPYRSTPWSQQYDVSPDGNRFLMIRPINLVSQDRAVLVLGFLDELRSRVSD